MQYGEKLHPKLCQLYNSVFIGIKISLFSRLSQMRFNADIPA